MYSPPVLFSLRFPDVGKCALFLGLLDLSTLSFWLDPSWEDGAGLRLVGSWAMSLAMRCPLPPELWQPKLSPHIADSLGEKGGGPGRVLRVENHGGMAMPCGHNLNLDPARTFFTLPHFIPLPNCFPSLWVMETIHFSVLNFFSL